MKHIKLSKYIPIFITLIISLLIGINNQKQSTYLKILIWKTPTLSVGNYLLLSSASGFIISYTIISCIVKNSLSRTRPKINKRSVTNQIQNQNQNNVDYELENEIPYNKTLIERDPNDPAPTINATFRVIGNTTRKDKMQVLENESIYYNGDLSFDSNKQMYNQEFDYKNDNKIDLILNDWNDDSYLYW